MQEEITRKLFLGFIQIHILHHGKKEPFYGAWMMEELRSHHYEISPGTLYPILHQLEIKGYLKRTEQVVAGKIRKYYATTELGCQVLQAAKEKVLELVREIQEDDPV